MNNIKTYLEEAVRKIESDKQRAVASIKEKVTREQIIPFNAEIDKSRDAAIAQRQAELNATIATQQEAFAKERQAYIDAAEKKKAENSMAVITSETAVVSAEYDRHIAKLNAQIQEIKE